jgi:hypothetical protein
MSVMDLEIWYNELTYPKTPGQTQVLERPKIPFNREHLTYAMSINTYRCQQLENLQLDHKEK